MLLQMLSITLPASVSRLCPHLSHPYLVGVWKEWFHGLHGADAGVFSSRVQRWSAGIPLHWLLPVGQGTGVLSARRPGTLCFNLLC